MRLATCAAFKAAVYLGVVSPEEPRLAHGARVQVVGLLRRIVPAAVDRAAADLDTLKLREAVWKGDTVCT